MAQLTPPPYRDLRVPALGLALSVLGALGVAIGLATDPSRTLLAYLTAFTYVASIAVGALFVLLIGYAANARWLSVLRRLCETLALGVVPLAVLFVPIALGMRWLYPWAGPPHEISAETLALLAHKRPYLNPGAFVARTVAYFGVWIAAALLLSRWSRRRTANPLVTGDPVAALRRERAFASVMLVPTGLAITFAAFDWLMSLDPLWYSSLFGIYYFAGGFLAAWALLTVLAHAGVRGGALAGVITPSHFHALGRLLLAFTVFWAYAAYFQVFLIRIADRPAEITFYQHRLHGPWDALAWTLVIGHFAVPFLLLLPRRLKYRSGYVAGIAAWILIMHFVDVSWLVLPTAGSGGIGLHWLDVAAILLVGGLTAATCAWAQQGVPLVAENDPLLAQGIRYVSST